MSVTTITQCRLCKSEDLYPVFDFGLQALTGYFPKLGEDVLKAPLNLAQCGKCKLLQLKDSVKPSILYGKNYGYKSSLNRSMVRHLKDIAEIIKSLNLFERGSFIVDIGANDGTFLKNFSSTETGGRIAIDPIIDKLENDYSSEVILYPEFFRKDLLPMQVQVITSFAMFYDLENPFGFMQDVYDCLVKDGLWVMEMQYPNWLINQGVYDFICHEHLCYFSAAHIKQMAEVVGFKLARASFNQTNGGSILYFFTKESAHCLYPQDPPINLSYYRNQIAKHKEVLKETIKGKNIFGYGASTKGNVVLQHCELTPVDIPFICDVNPDKYGCVTPGTNIPIISEEEAKSLNPEYFLVMPWHFKEEILSRNKDYPVKWIFPFPEVALV